MLYCVRIQWHLTKLGRHDVAQHNSQHPEAFGTVARGLKAAGYNTERAAALFIILYEVKCRSCG